MAHKASKGSWTLEDIDQALKTHANPNISANEPVTEKIEIGLIRSIPVDLYPFVIERITVEGVIRKSLAMSFLSWVVSSKVDWLVDPDKILSLRRIRVEQFVQRVEEAAMTSTETVELQTASVIVQRVNDQGSWHLSKSEFSTATMELVARTGMPIFVILDALVRIGLSGYDVSSAMRSVAIWATHISTDQRKTQLKLF